MFPFSDYMLSRRYAYNKCVFKLWDTSRLGETFIGRQFMMMNLIRLRPPYGFTKDGSCMPRLHPSSGSTEMVLPSAQQDAGSGFAQTFVKFSPVQSCITVNECDWTSADQIWKTPNPSARNRDWLRLLKLWSTTANTNEIRIDVVGQIIGKHSHIIEDFPGKLTRKDEAISLTSSCGSRDEVSKTEVVPILQAFDVKISPFLTFVLSLSPTMLDRYTNVFLPCSILPSKFQHVRPNWKYKW